MNNRLESPLDFATGLIRRPAKTDEQLNAEIAAYEELEQQRRARELLAVSGIPEEHKNAGDYTVDHLPVDVRAGWSHAAEIITQAIGRQAIVGLIGPRGTGKSTAAAASVIRECSAGRSAKYLFALDYIRATSEGRSFNARVTESEVERRHVAPLLLVIDELHMVAASDREDVALKSLLQRRWDARRPTVLIANETKAAFIDRVGQSVADRMRQSGSLIACEWKSLRVRG